MLDIKIAPTGKTIKVDSRWLRDHCRCPKCYNARTKQRLFNLVSMPKDLKAQDLKYSKEDSFLEITWQDGHVSEYEIDFIANSQYDKFQNRLVKESETQTIWDVPTILKNKSKLHFKLGDLSTSDQVVKDLMASLYRYGLVFIDDVPPTSDMTEMAVRRVFPLMKTLYGNPMFTFADVYLHDDITYSSDYIGPHTDHTYFCDGAGLQALHCVVHDGEGGENFFIDGYQVAKELRQRNPKAFEILSTVHVPAEFFDKDECHRYSSPTIRVDPVTKEIVQFRLNLYDRSIFDTIPQTEMRDFYESMREFLSIVHEPNNWFQLKLNPGTVVIFDNWRLLHGRCAYTGHRAMNGCFVARTDFLSKARLAGIIE
ncbi:trimethyllysine dioxygenase, mitochondrial-like [Haematobia irritans]|uniref:trimethyllysine dioxygenase, mitochondrial-like n=1 Tax=Haematobia irritans TaxID=7368 RepID=UPI003F504F49